MPKYCSETGAYLGTANDSSLGSVLGAALAAQTLTGLPALREGEVYAIDDSSYNGGGFDDWMTFREPSDLLRELQSIMRDREMTGRSDDGCDFPQIRIFREDAIGYEIVPQITFGA